MKHNTKSNSTPRESSATSDSCVSIMRRLIISHDVDGVSVYWDGPTDPPFEVITVDWDIACHEIDDIVGGVEVQDESGNLLRASVRREVVQDLESDYALQRAV